MPSRRAVHSACHASRSVSAASSPWAVAPTTSSSRAAAAAARSRTPEAKKIKVGLVTDIGGLNDRSFNQLANEGLERAKSELGVEGRVLTSKSNADYVPNLSTLAQQKYDLVIGVGFLMAEAMETVAKKFPDTNFAIIDYPQAAMKSKPTNVDGLLFKENEAGYLAGTLAGALHQGQGRRPGHLAPSAARRSRRSTRYIAGYQAGAKKANPDIKTAQRLLRGLRQAGPLQGARAQPDRGGLAGRLPGRRPVRPRRARRGQGEGRRRASASTPTRATSARTSYLERLEEGRRGRLQHGQGGPGRLVQGRRPTRSSTSSPAASAIGKLSADASKYEDQLKQVERADQVGRDHRHPVQGQVERSP